MSTNNAVFYIRLFGPADSQTGARKTFLAEPLMGREKIYAPATENFWILLLRVEHFSALFTPFLFETNKSFAAQI